MLRSSIVRVLLLHLAVLSVLMALAGSDSSLRAAEDRPLVLRKRAVVAEAAYFKFDIPAYPETFIFKLVDADRILEARDILADKRPNRIILGTIVKQPAAYNPPWSYHLDPPSIMFADAAIEVCDATIQYVEDNLYQVGSVILPGNVWCPWGSRLIAEVGVTVYLPVVLKQ